MARTIVERSPSAHRVPRILCDNLSSIRLAKNLVFHARTKHIEAHYPYIRENVLEGEIEMVPMKTDDQTANILPKSLNGAKLEKFREALDMWSARKILKEVCLEGEC